MTPNRNCFHLSILCWQASDIAENHRCCCVPCSEKHAYSNSDSDAGQSSGVNDRSLNYKSDTQGSRNLYKKVQDFNMDRWHILTCVILAGTLLSAVIAAPVRANAHSLFNQTESILRQKKARDAADLETSKKLERALSKNVINKNFEKKIASLEALMHKELAILETYTFRDKSHSQKDNQDAMLACVYRLKKLISEYDALCSPVKRICNRPTVGKARIAVRRYDPDFLRRDQ